MLIERATRKAHKETVMMDQNNVQHDCKILNILYNSLHPIRLDMQLSCEPTTTIMPGLVLFSPTGKCYTAVTFLPELFKGRLIRNIIDMVENNVTLTVKRSVVTPNNQGGVSGATPAIVYTDIHAKAGLYSELRVPTIDEDIARFSMLISSSYQLKVGDECVFSNDYERSKIEFIYKSTLGTNTVIFAKDPRW